MITSMIFFPDKTLYEKPQDYGFDWQDASVQTEDGIQLHGWYLKALEPKGAILHLHGNGGNISARLYKVKGWVERGFSVLLLDYRSYGKSQGEIKEGEDIYRDAKAGFEWVRKASALPDSKIILFGESLGSHPAVRLGAEYAVGAVVLESPYTSAVDLAKIHYAAIPGKDFLMKDFQFRNTDIIGRLKAPLFILHGTQDEICPYEMSETLMDQAPEPKGFFSIPGGTHNDLPIRAGEDYWEKPYQFVAKYISS